MIDKAARRFRRIVTPNIRKLLQYAILLVFRFFVSLYHSTRLPYRTERFAALFRPVIVYGCANAAVLPCNGGLLRFSARRFEQIGINRVSV